MTMTMDEYLKTREIEYSAGELADARRASVEKIDAYNLAQARKVLHLTQRQLEVAYSSPVASLTFMRR